MDPLTDVEFFRLTREDIPSMLALEQSCFSTPWSEEEFQEAFTQKHFAAFGLQIRPCLLAYISFYHVADELEILNFAVAPPHRRQGFGGRLLRMILQISRKMDIRRIVLEVRAGNVPALALYEGVGFKKKGRRPAYYADTGEDALICILDL